MFQLISNENKAFFLWVRVRVIFWQCEPEPYEPKILRTFTEPELKVRDTSMYHVTYQMKGNFIAN